MIEMMLLVVCVLTVFVGVLALLLGRQSLLLKNIRSNISEVEVGVATLVRDNTVILLPKLIEVVGSSVDSQLEILMRAKDLAHKEINEYASKRLEEIDSAYAIAKEKIDTYVDEVNSVAVGKVKDLSADSEYDQIIKEATNAKKSSDDLN